MFEMILMLAAQASGPWEAYKNDDFVWAARSGAVFTIKPSDISVTSPKTVWIRSDHTHDTTTKYRTGLFRIIFYCDGTTQTLAISHYDALGNSLYEWDGYGRISAIRPQTMLTWAEKVVCG